MKFIKQVLKQFGDDKCTTLAAALAYYTAFALPPLLFLLITITTFGLSVYYESGEARLHAHNLIESQVTKLLGNEIASDEISAILENTKEADGTWWKTLLSFAGILAGATGVVGALQTSLNQVWSVQPNTDSMGFFYIFRKRIFSLGMILALGFLLLVSLIASSIVVMMGERLGGLIGIDQILANIANYVMQAIFVWTIFATIFKYMPDAIVRWKDVFVGASITTVLFLVGRSVMQIYFTSSPPGAQLGSAAASFAVILAWVYYSAMIVLLGAEATQVYATKYGQGILPEEYAVKVVKKIES